MSHIIALASCATCRDLASATGSMRRFGVRASLRESVRQSVTLNEDDDDMRRRVYK